VTLHITPGLVFDTTDPISWLILAALALVAYTCVYWITALWFPRRRDRRPWCYRPRHRAEHQGVTLTSPPLRDLMPAEGHLRHDEPVPSVADLEPDVDQLVAQHKETEKAAATGSWPVVWSDAFNARLADFDRRVALIERACDAMVTPDSLAYREAIADEATGAWRLVDIAPPRRETSAQLRRRVHKENHAAARAER